jgi:hypothetical protein
MKNRPEELQHLHRVNQHRYARAQSLHRLHDELRGLHLDHRECPER